MRLVCCENLFLILVIPVWYDQICILVSVEEQLHKFVFFLGTVSRKKTVVILDFVKMRGAVILGYIYVVFYVVYIIF